MKSKYLLRLFQKNKKLIEKVKELEKVIEDIRNN